MKFEIQKIEGGYIITTSGIIPSQAEVMQLFKMDNPMASLMPLMNALTEKKIFYETLDEVILKLKDVFK